MRKLIIILMCVVVIFSVAGCGGNSSKDGSGNDVNKAEHQSGVNANADAPQDGDRPDVKLSNTKGIDVDLTELSSTMVYSEVYNMLSAPDDYKGKVIQMGGEFAVYHDENTKKDYFACIIQDATACCQQGMEFVLSDDYSYPDDYPKEGGEIKVKGVFDTYKEGDQTYCTLKNAELVD